MENIDQDIKERAEQRYGTEIEGIRGSNPSDLQLDSKRGYIAGATEERERDKWISVKDKLPEEDLEVNIYIQKFGVRDGYVRVGWIDSEKSKWMLYCESGEHYFENSIEHKVDYYKITHWCLVPGPLKTT